jgi:hypothetical protein
MITVIDALHSLRPMAQWSIFNGTIDWLDLTQTQPTEAEINAEITRLQAEYNAKQYQRDRALVYPSLQEQLDMQYWDAINGTTTWQDAITAVKQQFPKEQ